MYIFTNSNATKILAIRDLSNGAEALIVRRELQECKKTAVIAWCHVGQNNPKITTNNKKYGATYRSNKSSKNVSQTKARGKTTRKRG